MANRCMLVVPGRFAPLLPGLEEAMKKIDEQTIIEAGNSICESIAELIEVAKLLGIDVEKYLNEGDDIDEEVDDGK
jgi:hypothetical protein